MVQRLRLGIAMPQTQLCAIPRAGRGRWAGVGVAGGAKWWSCERTFEGVVRRDCSWFEGVLGRLAARITRVDGGRRGRPLHG